MSTQHTPSTLDALQTRLISSLKQSPPSYNNAISILSDLRENISQIVHGPHYAHWLRTWIPIVKDILTDVNVAKKGNKAKDGKKEGKDVKGIKEKEKKPHALFVAPKYNGIRRCLLDILTRCPLNDVFHGHAGVVLSCCVNVVLVDSEENALIATNLIFQIHKVYRTISADPSNTSSVSRTKGEEAKQVRECQVFLDFVCDCFSEANKKSGGSLEKTFDFTKQISVSSGDAKVSMPSVPAKQSLRMLTEGTLTATLMFQLFPKSLKANITTMIPLMMDFLKLAAPRFVDPSKTVTDTPVKNDSPTKEAITPITPAVNTGKVSKETPVAETPRHSANGSTPMTGLSSASAPPDEALYRLYRIRVHELLTAQSKTLSFITFLLQGYADQMRPYEDVMADNIVCLMKNCPRDALSIRKELFVSTRHILSTEFQRGFYRHVDIMMNERLTDGNSRNSNAAEQSLRQLGYYMLADLLQHARAAMTPAQLGRAVRIFSRVLHDAGMDMPLHLQAHSVRLLSHLVDPIYSNRDPNPQVGRDLLVRIMSAFVQKFHSIKAKIPELMENAEKEIEEANNGRTTEEDGSSTVIKSDGSSCTDMRHIQSILHTMFNGMKSLIWFINSYALGRKKEHDRVLSSGEEQFPLPSSATLRENEEVNSALMKMTNGERDLVIEYVAAGLPCLRAFRLQSKSEYTESPRPQFEEVLDLFVASISLSERGHYSNIRRTLQPNLELIMSEMDTYPELSSMFKRLLLSGGNSISYEIFSLLFTYLSDNISVLGEFQKTEGEKSSETNQPMHQAKLNIRAQNHFKLFIISMNSIRHCPKNEIAILPHLRTLVTECLERSMEQSATWPGPYLCIIQMLFRVLNQQSSSYKELEPLIPSLLNGFYRIFSTTNMDLLRNMMVELVLTVPAHRATLLPHLPLIVKMAAHALESNRVDLVSLGLRILEFWVNNVQPDYFYQVLAQNRDTLCQLMISLNEQLQPTPHPHSRLALRVLGKLGGLNRVFQHEVVCQDSETMESETLRPGLSVSLEWQHKNSHHVGDPAAGSFSIRLPLERALDVLRNVADAPHYIANQEETTRTHLPLNPLSSYAGCLFNGHAEDLDLNLHALELLRRTNLEQAKSAFAIIRAGLATLLDLPTENANICIPTSNAPTDESQGPTDPLNQSDNTFCTKALKLICDALFVATSIKELEEKAMMLLKGLGSHIVFVIESHVDCIARTDCDGAVVDHLNGCVEQNHLSGGKLHPLQPFGCYRLSSPLVDDVDPFIFHTSLVDAIVDSKPKCSSSQDRSKLCHAALEVMMSTLDLADKVKASLPKNDGKSTSSEGDLTTGEILAEHLLSSLCQSCFSHPWHCRSSLMTAIMKLLTLKGVQWSRRFEVEVLHVAMFVVKDAPTEITVASKEALTFFITVSWFFFGGPASWNSTIVHDVLSQASDNPPESESELDSSTTTISEAPLTMIISEIACTKQLVRFAVRHFLRIVSHDTLDNVSAIKDNMPSLKRIIFPRILRNSPLPEQIAIVEATAFMMERAPSHFSLEDQTCLSFTAELLKMLSVADGDISDRSMSSVVLIDKDGFAVQNNSQETKRKVHSSVFLRTSFNLENESFGGCVVVPKELPPGVQLRVAAIYLFRSIMRKFPSQFFDAQNKSQVGNLRPHVVSLLFRCLTSESEDVVSAAESALRDALVLRETEEDDPKESHRLPRDLIQTCIRPIIVNLKDHTKLTLPLIRAISRLLVLLTGWFNKSIGEKMIEHLVRLTEKEKVLELRLWTAEEAPKIAASIIELFHQMPAASRFVEVLVKLTAKLEKEWDLVGVSPFREPLALFLNRHCASAVGFFLDSHRLSNPVYSELFRDVLQRECATDLRDYLKTKESIVMLLNTCFERPLALIRSEKTQSSSGLSTSLEVYGINTLNSYSAQRKLEIARYDIVSKRSKLAKLKQDNGPQVRKTADLLEEELKKARLSYSNEISKHDIKEDTSSERPMTTHALELQHQGFCVINILVQANEGYLNLEDQNDIIKALRWLWRSRGRHYRLVNEEEIQPRYHRESLMLANFLISYSKANPSDVDILFDLIRIFLNQTSIDFSFVKEFIHHRVTYGLTMEQRGILLQRYLAVLSTEGSEDNKVISTSLLVLPMLKHTLSANNREESAALMNDAVMKQLLKTMFYGSCSSKLTCQFLQLINVFLQHLADGLAEYRKDVLKYVWGILKGDDPSTKCYAYLGVSRFVSAFETPVKVTLQVYRSLLRSYNTADQDLVQASLQILVPQLERRLSSDELEVALKYTSKIIQEEGNSVQQLAHLLQCITRHPEVYRRCSSVLISQMIHTLSIVGVSPNSLNSELKQLLISVAKLVFDWSTPPAQQTVVVALVNFLVKVILLNAEEKAELTHHRIHSQAMTLLSRILSFHPKVHLSKVHFERVLALGTANDDALTISSDASKKTIEKNKTMTEENCNTVLVYIASLEVLSIFLTSKSLDALKSIDTRGVIVRCFSHDSSVKDRKVQELLKEFVANSIGSSVLDHATLVPLLEEAIIAASSSATGREDEVKIQRSCLAIDIIVNICATNPVFVEPLIGSLLGFVKAFETTSPAHESQNETRGLKSPATPTLGVFHYACGIGVMSDSMTIDYNLGYKHGETHVLPKESLSAPQKAQIQIIRLLSTSSVLSTFSDTRRRFIEALLLLLDSSSCIPLLITVLSIVSDLVLKKKKQNCVIRSEKEELLLRMAHFDFNKLPITASQIIADMVCIITLCLCGFDPSSHTFTAIEHNHHGMESVRNKLFPLCLLSGNCTLRSMALRVFAKKKLTSEPSTNFFGIPHTSPHDVIYQYFNADLECIGNRMHTVLLTDLLLAVSKYKGGISQEGYLRPRRKSSSENIHKIKPQELSEEHSVFVEHLLLDQNETQCGNGSCILTAIRDLIHLDISTNQSILESCAQAAWDQLPSHHERIALIESLEKLLSMPYHFQFLDIKRGVGPWNVIQSILRLAFHLRPMPWIDSKLLLTLSTKYSMHYEVLAYLEQQYQALTRNDLKESSDSTMMLQNINELFSYLNDRDVSLGISSAICSLPGTKFALSLDKYGEYNKSTDAYLSLLNRADENSADTPPEVEVYVWSKRWIEAHKEMGQWSVIEEVAYSTEDKNLLLESALKTNNFGKVKSILREKSSNIATLETSDTRRMAEICLAITRGKLTEADNLIAEAIQTSLHKSILLPQAKAGVCGPRENLYQEFQRLVEFRESCQMIMESTTASNQRGLPDLKTVLTAWRHRSPNLYEPLSVWEDIFRWRLHIFDSIAKLFAWNDPAIVSTLHDRSYASIVYGRAARKQNLTDIANVLMMELTDSMSLPDAFLKMREQIVINQYSPDANVLKGGLNLALSTNLTYFDSRQKAEMLRLKSYFYSALNDKSNAHKSYSHTLQINPNYGRAWVDWGHLCASIPNNSSSESNESKRKVTIQYKAQALGCYLEAIRCDTSEKSRENIPHCLSMLSLDSAQYGNLFQAFQSRAPLLPAWVWLPWQAQLLTSLCRVEANAIQAVLMRIANDHPQALYYSLRAFFLERRDIDRSRDQGSGERQEDDAQNHAEILMSNLRKVHPVLWSRLEAILEDLIIRFRPSYESELLATIKALLEKAKTKTKQTDKDDDSEKTALLESLRGNLSKISQKFFNKEKAEGSKGRKTLLFEKKWHAAFDRDFVPNENEESNQGLASIEELIEKLESWKAQLEHHISLVPKKCHLQETSPSLSWYSCQPNDLWPGACESSSLSLNTQHDYQASLDNALYEATKASTVAAYKASSEDVIAAAKAEGLGGHEGGGSALVEIPGQYAPTSSNVYDTRPFPELHAKLVHFHQILEVVSTPTKQDQTVRQITMIGSDGKRYTFSLQLAIPYWTRTDERSAQLQYIVNNALRQDIQACRRGLSVRANVVIPVAQRMRMTANHPYFTSLESVLYHVKGPKAQLATFFEEEVASRFAVSKIDIDDSQATDKIKLDVYRHICQELVPKNVLSEYMSTIIPSAEQLMQFRKVFASQLGINSVLQHIFAVTERTPSRFVFCNRSGRVLAQDFRFQYNQGIIEPHNVPFRMTRTIADFIGPFYLEGAFVPAFVCTSSALKAKQSTLESILHILLRDDIISWYISKTQPRNDRKMQEMEHQLSERVSKNIRYVQTRIEECSIRPVANAAEEAISENPQPVDAHVRHLVDAATSEEKLCLMSPGYQAWL